MKSFLSEFLRTVLLSLVPIGIFLAERYCLKGFVGLSGLLGLFLTPVTIFLFVLAILRLASKRNGTLWMRKDSRVGAAVRWFSEFGSRRILGLSLDITLVFMLSVVILTCALLIPLAFYVALGSTAFLLCVGVIGIIFAFTFFVKMSARFFRSDWFKLKMKPVFSSINPEIQLRE